MLPCFKLMIRKRKCQNMVLFTSTINMFLNGQNGNLIKAKFLRSVNIKSQSQIYWNEAYRQVACIHSV